MAAATRIIYGGSVTAGNCGTLADCTDIDGFLVRAARWLMGVGAKAFSMGEWRRHLLARAVAACCGHRNSQQPRPARSVFLLLCLLSPWEGWPALGKNQMRGAA